MKNESGRSMVEMLGVLAIIGVLSIGGIAGYTLAMNRYKANNVVNAMSLASIYAMTANGGEGQDSYFCTGELTSCTLPEGFTDYTKVKLSSTVGGSSFPTGMTGLASDDEGKVTAWIDEDDYKIGKLAYDILAGGKADESASTCDGLTSAADCKVVADMQK